MPKFYLNWKSTPAERYDESPDSMNIRAERATGLLGQIFSRDGGTDNMSADNSLGIEVSGVEAAIKVADAVSAEIDKVVTVVDEGFQQVYATPARFKDDDVSGMLTWAADVVDKQGGRMSLAADPPSPQSNNTRYMIGLDFGEETPGSMMYAGAAYGQGSTLAEALTNLIKDSGL